MNRIEAIQVLLPDIIIIGVTLFIGLVVILPLGKLFKKGKNHKIHDHSDSGECLDLDLNDSYQILDGALHLFYQRWFDKTKKSLFAQKKKVVEYLSPEEMLQKLFHNDDKFNLLKENLSFSLKDSISREMQYKSNAKAMIELLSLIQKYSVDTSHPYFFNQLFGATDPVALAAEIVSLSLNTSTATYEIAPIITLIEKEVVSSIGKIVYGENFGMPFDGMMIPGGSLSNLTALHVARHYFLSNYMNGQMDIEEKKKDDWENNSPRVDIISKLVAFVSQEAHYSFLKAAAVIGLSKENLIQIPTLSSGEMNTKYLGEAIRMTQACHKYPFFVGVTSGSTVRGSFDSIEDVMQTCNMNGGNIWVHVDGAWGGVSIFSDRKEIRNLMKGVETTNSFTFNPHKMLGAPQQTTVFVSRHENILKSANASKAKYLFDNEKNGAQFDIGDGLFTCGRRTDAVKIWAMIKFYGISSLGNQVDKKVDSLRYFAERVRNHEKFMLACEPWPFNVNFYYLPKRFQAMLDKAQISTKSFNPVLPDDISDELGIVSVNLKKILHEAGEMLIPYQPLSNQRAFCFRLVLAGQKDFSRDDAEHILSVIDRYGADL